MTQNEIIEMAKQSGLLDMDFEVGDWEIHEFTTFAKLVADAAAAKEREACASIEYDLAKSPAMFATMAEYKAYKDGVQEYRARIVARGEA